MAINRKWKDPPNPSYTSSLIVFKVKYWHIKYSVHLRGDEQKGQMEDEGKGEIVLRVGKRLDGEVGLPSW